MKPQRNPVNTGYLLSMSQNDPPTAPCTPRFCHLVLTRGFSNGKQLGRKIILFLPIFFFPSRPNDKTKTILRVSLYFNRNYCIAYYEQILISLIPKLLILKVTGHLPGTKNCEHYFIKKTILKATKSFLLLQTASKHIDHNRNYSLKEVISYEKKTRGTCQGPL